MSMNALFVILTACVVIFVAIVGISVYLGSSEDDY